MKRMTNAMTYAELVVNPGAALDPNAGFVLRRKSLCIIDIYSRLSSSELKRVDPKN